MFYTGGEGCGRRSVGNVVALEEVLAAVRRRWGHQSIVRLAHGAVGAPGQATDDAAGGRLAAEARRPPRRLREQPPWWPVALAGGAVLRPRSLEIAGAAGSGRLSLALAWLAAARPALAAVVDGAGSVALAGRGGSGRAAGNSAAGAGAAGAAPPAMRFYPPAAASAGVPVERLIVVRPPTGEPRAALDAAAVLLRSEAFDVMLCPLPSGARIGLTAGGKLATLAARSGTTLLLLTPLTPPGPRGYGGGLGDFAEFRVRLMGRRWLWEDGELAGVKLRVATERARAAAGNDLGETPPEHELTLRLHRSVRHGPLESLAAAAENDGGASRWAPDRFYLSEATRVAPPAAAPPLQKRSLVGT